VKVLVTGAGGFAGRHLVDYLLAQGDRVVAAFEHQGQIPPPANNLLPLVFDMTDDQAVSNALYAHDIDAAIHLAAIAFVPAVDKKPARAMAVNVGGAAALLKAIKSHRPRARILLISSAEVYGRSAGEGNALTESDPLHPVNLYGQTKLLAEQFARWFAEHQGLDVIIARPFPHLGPGQDPAFSVSGFARQLATVAAHQAKPVLHVGNLSVRRDFTDVRDVVRAYRAALEKMPSGETFNICSGRDYLLSDLVDMLIRESGVSVKVEVSQSRRRSNDLFFLRGSAEHLFRQTGWRPELPIEQTLRDIYQFWRDQPS
jgi:GDP-4-dehydro-6-deoxy-D-mannose reductase